MLSQQDALYRGLRQFFEMELSGLTRFDSAEVKPLGEGDGKMRAVFTLGDREHAIIVHSSEESPPLGMISLNGMELGPIDGKTWSDAGHILRTVSKEVSDE